MRRNLADASQRKYDIMYSDTAQELESIVDTMKRYRQDFDDLVYRPHNLLGKIAVAIGLIDPYQKIEQRTQQLACYERRAQDAQAKWSSIKEESDRRYLEKAAEKSALVQDIYRCQKALSYADEELEKMAADYSTGENMMIKSRIEEHMVRMEYDKEKVQDSLDIYARHIVNLDDEIAVCRAVREKARAVMKTASDARELSTTIRAIYRQSMALARKGLDSAQDIAALYQAVDDIRPIAAEALALNQRIGEGFAQGRLASSKDKAISYSQRQEMDRRIESTSAVLAQGSANLLRLSDEAMCADKSKKR